jgi:hypothetical protein
LLDSLTSLTSKELESSSLLADGAWPSGRLPRNLGYRFSGRQAAELEDEFEDEDE